MALTCQHCGSPNHYTVQHFQLEADARNKLRPLGPASKEGQPMDQSKMKICYTVTKRNGKSFWSRIGVAFVNNDGSLNVRLDALPVNGEMNIRDYVATGLGATEPTPEDRTDDAFEDS